MMSNEAKMETINEMVKHYYTAIDHMNSILDVTVRAYKLPPHVHELFKEAYAVSNGVVKRLQRELEHIYTELKED